MPDLPLRPDRLLSIAAGVSPELAADPLSFVTAAGQAGWPATGVWHDADTWTDSTAQEIASRVDDLGLVVLDMEVVRMGTDRDRGEALVDAAAAIGARNILTVSSFDDPHATAARFSVLCERAAPAGIRVCLEFMKFTTVKTLTDAVAVLALAGQPNAGILVDLLHVDRSGTTFDDISAADPDLFPYVQWCDAPADARGTTTRDLIADALDDRMVPGAGGLAAIEFESLFAPEVPFSLEVRSKALREAFADHTERAAHLLAATQQALDF